MVKVIESQLPQGSVLADRVSPTDFLDCFEVSSDIAVRKAANIIVDFPIWAKFLLLIRKVVTVPFGLSNDGPPAADKIGPFPVELETENELIAGFNDKHLDFRVSVISQDKKVYLATWVHPNNVGGRFYLSVILPFHVLIARNALLRVAAQR